jgi:hypothetical protein
MRSIVSLVMFASTAQATDVKRPVELEGSISAAAPIGTGELSRLFIVAYEAALWSDAAKWSYEAPFALTIRYRMNFTTDELVDRTIEEMRGQGSVSAADEVRYRALLVKAFPNVKDGEQITALYVPKETVRFFHQGKPTGEIEDAVFARRFFDIWLSDKTTEPSLRRGLLKLP